MVPRWPNVAPSWPKMAPRWPKMARLGYEGLVLRPTFGPCNSAFNGNSSGRARPRKLPCKPFLSDVGNSARGAEAVYSDAKFRTEGAFHTLSPWPCAPVHVHPSKASAGTSRSVAHGPARLTTEPLFLAQLRRKRRGGRGRVGGARAACSR